MAESKKSLVAVFKLIFESIIKLDIDVKIILSMFIILMSFWFASIYLIAPKFFTARPIWATFLLSFICSATSYTATLFVVFIASFLSNKVIPETNGTYQIKGFITTITGTLVILFLGLSMFLCYYLRLNFLFLNLLFYGILIIRIILDTYGAMKIAVTNNQ